MMKEKPTKADKIDREELIFPPVPDSSTLLVACPPGSFAASRMARAAEDVDASVLNLNVTSIRREGYEAVVEMRVSHRNPERAARSLERYGYDVLSYTGADSPADDDELRSRLDQLLLMIN